MMQTREEISSELLRPKDFGTPQLHKRQAVNQRSGNAYVEDQFQYDKLRKLSLITENMYTAARTFHYLWTYAGFDTMALPRFGMRGRTPELLMEDLGLLPDEHIPLRQWCEQGYKAALKDMDRRNISAVQDVVLYDRHSNKIVQIRYGLADLYKHFEEKHKRRY